MKKLAILLALLVVVTAIAPAAAMAPEAGKDAYVVIMAADPVVAYEGGVDGLQATKPAKGEKINPNSALVKKYEMFLEKEHSKALAAVGVSQSAKTHDYTIALNGFAAQLTEVQAAQIAKQPGVAMVLKDVMRYKTTDNSPTFLGLNSEVGAWLSGYTGENVVVGVIDTGIWPEHPSFADDGSYPALADYAGLPCEFGNTAANANDASFTCNNKLLGAYQILDTYRSLTGADPDEFDSARDDDGHGTHTASTAAGNAGVEATIRGVSFGTVSGIAPRARIIAYKALGNLGGYTSDLAAAIDKAVADGVDVINYSIGGGAGAPGADDLAFLFAADAGVFVANSAGNDGPGAETVGSPAVWPWVTTVGASTQNRTFQGSVELGNGSVYTGVSITASTEMLPVVDSATLGNELCISDPDPDQDGEPIFTSDVSDKIVLCKRGSNARVDKGYAVYLADGAGMILYNVTDAQELVTDTHWVPTMHINNTDGLAIKGYIAAETGPTAKINGGTYTEVPAPVMAAFSSRGPNAVAADIIKPDITAPGVNILAGASPFPDPGFVPGELFQSISGTSMSSPHVAGVFALLKQAHPEWSAAAAKSALMTTAYQDVMKEDGMTWANPFDIGNGHIDPSSVANGSPFAPGVVYEAGLYDYFGFLCDVYPAIFLNPGGMCGALESMGVPTKAYNLNYPSIGVAELPGTITVQRTVTNVSKSALQLLPTVKAPEGYTVEVSPQVLVVPTGKSASYAVKITNISAPAGEWRFGSLTWVSDRSKGSQKQGYEAYSPIAVKAALFNAPAEISGMGVDGSASFDVTFGYTGSYTAAAHGLVPATVTLDNVAQDPDQTFDPGDGFSDLHMISLSGAAYFRLAVPPEGTETDADLDIYVYNPNGEFVASSTGGGTDEQIDIAAPMDGDWYVFVHGWAAPGGDSPYTMYTWAIPAASGGNLTIDSAPASATAGATETIQVSWTGATAGEWHLGAVSHTGDSGLMGLTLVNVDNR